jgi:hypothetical protein
MKILVLFFMILSANVFADNSCQPRTGECVAAACEIYRCSFQSELEEIARACVGNYDGSCVKTSCKYTSCSSRSNLIDVIQTCRGNFNGDCLEYACNEAGCNSKSDLQNYAQSCKNTDLECVKILCTKGSGCSFRTQMLRAIDACAGR